MPHDMLFISNFLDISKRKHVVALFLLPLDFWQTMIHDPPAPALTFQSLEFPTHDKTVQQDSVPVLAALRFAAAYLHHWRK